jgi:hypothetical protein
MRRPPLWAWALPAAVALGLLLGLQLRPVPPAAPPPSPRGSMIATPPLPAVPPAVATSFPALELPDTGTWGMDGGAYQPLDAPAYGDTLPAAPEDAATGSPEAALDTPPHQPPSGPGPLPRSADGPAQGLGREAAYARPLVAAARAGGRLSFYSAWDAPAAREALVGEWARVGACAGTVRLGYEQPAGGLGAMRGTGDAAEPPAWDVALVVARQHCGAASSRWRAARAPTPEEQALLAPFLAGELPNAVVTQGEVTWASSARRAVILRRAGGRAVARWSVSGPNGASVRLLGIWEGDGVWAAVETGGRILRVWRVPGER